MVSLLVKEKMYINEVVLGTGFGVIIGPYMANVFDPRSWGSEENRITLEVMRVVLATGLFAVGVELPCAYMKDHAKSLLVMVVPTMAFGWLIVSSKSVLHFLFPQLDQVSALCIAACLTPTDPAVNLLLKHVPVDIRRIISAESAANDGLAYPFLALALYLTVETSTRVAIGKWFLVGWLYQVILGTILGAILGLLFSKLMKLSHHKGFIDRESYIAQYLALSIFTIGLASTLGTDDLLAAFAAGSAISWDGHFNVQTADDSFSSVIDYVLNCGCFIYIGAWLPFDSYNSSELGLTPWRLVVLMIAILVLRRIPPLLLLYRFIPEIASWKEALVLLGILMGVSAVFVSALALTRLPVPATPPENQAQLLAATIQPIVSFIVLGSIIVHGLSIPFFSLGRGVHSRTLSLSLTWTRTRGSGPLPDWVYYVRRSEGNGGPPVAPDTAVDIERGIDNNDKTEESDGSDSVPDQTDSRRRLTIVTRCSSGSGFGFGDNPSGHTEVAVGMRMPDGDELDDKSPVQTKQVRFPSPQ
ncbi:Sodium/hydrogen exchanger family-domain-containing protein [Melanogaster broomeanus]|nr:Sodium/hydrogen exchanger family-domain-containing protein [Melanogaster broomeanus]